MLNKTKLKDSEFYKHNAKICLRNPLNKAWNEHETIKLLTSLAIYQKYGKAVQFLATEYPIPKSKDIADIYAIIDKKPMVYEIQKEITKKWTDKIIKRDLKTKINTIVIPLKDYPLLFSDLMVRVIKFKI